jgi:hypothetical protein
MPQLWTALSIKQPWAALLVHGIKTVEVRTWLTGKTGKILIHASKSLEPDPDAWRHISTPELMTTAGLVGGVIGVAELCECITYSSRDAYAADTRHCTGAERFQPPRMYGFRFKNAKRVEFLPWLGNTNFFSVKAEVAVLRKPKKPPRPKLAKYLVRLPEDGPR